MSDNGWPLEIWTVYRDPKDIPHCRFVVRVHAVSPGHAGPTNEAYGASTLEDIRSIIPTGLVRIDRDPSDDPVIVECWL